MRIHPHSGIRSIYLKNLQLSAHTYIWSPYVPWYLIVLFLSFFLLSFLCFIYFFFLPKTTDNSICTRQLLHQGRKVYGIYRTTANAFSHSIIFIHTFIRSCTNVSKYLLPTTYLLPIRMYICVYVSLIRTSLRIYRLVCDVHWTRYAARLNDYYTRTWPI